MITGRAAPGKTRTCPHCRATILDSATVCPGCHHHLRFDSAGAGQRVQPAATPLRVEGTLRHPVSGGALEYSVVLAIRNDRGEEIARQVVGVGALQPGDARTFSLAVEVFKPAEMRESKPQPTQPAQRPAADSRLPEVRAPGRAALPPAAAALAAPPRPLPIPDGKSGGIAPVGRPTQGSAPPKWPLPAAPTSTSGKYPSPAAVPGATGRYPAAAAPTPTAAPGKAAPAAAPTPQGSSRAAPGQPLRAPQAPALNGGATAPGRGGTPGAQPKRP